MTVSPSFVFSVFFVLPFVRAPYASLPDFQRFSVAPRVAVMDTRALVWPIDSGLRSFGMTPRVGVMESHTSPWPLNQG